MEKEYLVISNKGEIELEALTLLGGTTKRNDNTKIGYWGTGNKYALACLMNKGINVKIFSGYKEIKLSLATTKYRDTEFKVIAINGNPTSITTNFGPQWDIWHAIREIYSNALDEKEAYIGKTLDYTQYIKENYTVFIIEVTDEISDIVNNLGKYFSEFREVPLFKERSILIYKRLNEESGNVYRKGILVLNQKDKINTIFDYDFPDLDINELRECEKYSLRFEISYAIRHSHNKELLELFFKNFNTSKFEYQCGFDNPDCSKEYAEVLSNYVLVPDFLSDYHHSYNNALIIPTGMYKALLKCDYVYILKFPCGYGTESFVISKEKTERHKEEINAFVEVLKRNGYEDIPNIFIGKFTNKEELGAYERKGKRIILSDLLFPNPDNSNDLEEVKCEYSFKEVLLHEVFHHISELSDDYSFNHFIVKEFIKFLR